MIRQTSGMWESENLRIQHCVSCMCVHALMEGGVGVGVCDFRSTPQNKGKAEARAEPGTACVSECPVLSDRQTDRPLYHGFHHSAHIQAASPHIFFLAAIT